MGTRVCGGGGGRGSPAGLVLALLGTVTDSHRIADRYGEAGD